MRWCVYVCAGELKSVSFIVVQSYKSWIKTDKSLQTHALTIQMKMIVKPVYVLQILKA